MTKAQTLREYIAHRKAQIEDLEKRYGTGVRPGWIGEEITMLTFYMQDAEDQLKQLEQNNATDHSTN
jgi:primosomal protein N''